MYVIVYCSFKNSPIIKKHMLQRSLLLAIAFSRHLRNKQFLRQFQMSLILISRGKQGNDFLRFLQYICYCDYSRSQHLLVLSQQQKHQKKVRNYSELTIKTVERFQWRRSGVLTVDVEHTSRIFLMFMLLFLNR